MSEFTLTVPAEYAEDFRAALVEEIASDIQNVQHDRRALAERMADGRTDLDIRKVDLRNAMRQLDRDIGLGVLVGLEGDGEIEIRNANPADLFAICEAMARVVVEPRLRQALEYGPIDSGGARSQLGALSWAIDHAEELERAGIAERQAEGGAA